MGRVGISTPMPLAGHDFLAARVAFPHIISTPMPLAGHDLSVICAKYILVYFYSHAPRGA